MVTAPTSNAHFHELSYAGDKPVAVIAINVGEVTTGVTCWVCCPGQPPFVFERKPAPTKFKYGEQTVVGIPFHLFPPGIFAANAVFQSPELPRNKTAEEVLVDYLTGMQKELSGFLRGIPFWDSIKENVHLVVSHPGILESHKVQRLQHCVEKAGWLDLSKREAKFISEETAMIVQNQYERLVASKKPPTSYVVVNECGPAMVSVTRYELGTTGSWWASQEAASPISCSAGFAVAYNFAKSISERRQPVPTEDVHVVQYAPRQIVKQSRESRVDSYYESKNDVHLSMSEAQQCYEHSVEQLVIVLTQLHRATVTDSCLVFSGNFLGNDDVRRTVRNKLGRRRDYLTYSYSASSSTCARNEMCFEYNYGAILYYLRRINILRTPQPRDPVLEGKPLSKGTLSMGLYRCYHYTPGGVPPTIKSRHSDDMDSPLRTEIQNLVPKVQDSELHRNITKIQSSAIICYHQIHPWLAATTDLGFMTSIVDEMRSAFELYAAALNSSVASSKSGYTISVGCEELCKLFQEGIQADKLRGKISNLQTKAKKALDDATQMREAFRKVRDKVIQASNAIRKMITDLRKIDAAIGKIELLSPHDKQPSLSSGTFSDAPTLPGLKKAPLTPQNSDEANSDLLLALNTVNLLEGHVGFIIEWWLEVHTRLTNLDEKAGKLSPTRILRLEIKAATQNWHVVKTAYSEYEKTVTALLETSFDGEKTIANK